ncbi:MAG: hypothetical protein HC915_11285 [Anaerolineae bacterium]|nr:hypothetical protein [Anaerolineae bacterium]
MELSQLWEMLLRRWWVILLPVVVALLLLLPTVPGILSPEVRYQVVMRFTAAPPSTVELDPATTYEDAVYVPWLASEYVVVNLPPWITSDSFAAEVSAVLAEAGLALEPDDLRPAFVADSARSILIVYLNWDDEAEIEAIARAAVEVLQTRNGVYFPQFAAIQQKSLR